MKTRRVLAEGGRFAMMEQDVPRKPSIKTLFYIRPMPMGFGKATRILRHERETLEKHFARAEKCCRDAGRSKVWVCR